MLAGPPVLLSPLSSSYNMHADACLNTSYKTWARFASACAGVCMCARDGLGLRVCRRAHIPEAPDCYQLSLDSGPLRGGGCVKGL